MTIPTRPQDLPDLLAFAHALADAARPIAMQHFRQPLAIENKADDSPVTIADRAIETQMRRMIAERFPAHGVFGEEFENRFGSEFTWVLDPIDGTRSFISGMPLFASLIALTRHGELLLGVVDFPAMNERWACVVGEPARHDSAACRTSECVSLSQARLYATSPDMFEGGDAAAFASLSKRVGMRRFGGDAYAYALLASGHCDVIAESGLKPYDYLPLVAVIEGAGGVVTDWQGKKLGFASDGRVLASANRALHAAALQALREGEGA